MQNNLNSLLKVVISKPELHAKWLNTFSYLEYIGFRKIVKSQMAGDLDLETLGHMVEEGRHSLMLKKLAVKVGGSKFNTYATEFCLCRADGDAYFQDLDRACENHIKINAAPEKTARLTYLYVTWLVELRALSIYGAYQEALEASGLKPSLNGLLAEEGKHLSAVEKELFECDSNFDTRSYELHAVEKTLYQNYILALAREVLGSELFREAFT